MSLLLRSPLKTFGGVPRRAPPPFVGALVVVTVGLGFGSSGVSSGGSANNGANAGCSDGSSWILIAVST